MMIKLLNRFKKYIEKLFVIKIGHLKWNALNFSVVKEV